MQNNPNNAIGVFDSGVGGLTVVRALMERLPFENIIYFGDTARVPYGVKSVRNHRPLHHPDRRIPAAKRGQAADHRLQHHGGGGLAGGARTCRRCRCWT